MFSMARHTVLTKGMDILNLILRTAKKKSRMMVVIVKGVVVLDISMARLVAASTGPQSHVIERVKKSE